MALGIFLVDISREMNKSRHFAHPTDLLRTAVETELNSSDSVFTGWTIHAKACARLPSRGGKFKVAATRRSGRSGAMRPHHACYRREKGREKEWQEIISTSVTLPSLLSHPFRGGRPSTKKMHNWAVATWQQSSLDCCSPLPVSRVWLVPLCFFSELWIMSTKSSWNTCMSRAQLQATMPSAGSLKAPNGTTKINAANSMILCV